MCHIRQNLGQNVWPLVHSCAYNINPYHIFSVFFEHRKLHEADYLRLKISLHFTIIYRSSVRTIE